MYDLSGAVLTLVNAPDLLDAHSIRLWVHVASQVELIYDRFRKRAVCPLRQQSHLGEELHAWFKVVLHATLLVQSNLVRGDTTHGTLLVKHETGTCKARIDLNTHFFSDAV